MRCSFNALGWVGALLLVACAGATEAPDGGLDGGPTTLEAGADGRVDADVKVELDGEVGDAGPLEVEIGIPTGEDGLGFAAFEPEQELRLQTFGQGGTHVMLGVRTRGFGSRAFVDITLRNLASGAEALSPAPVRPQLLWCHPQGHCDLVPLLAMTAGLVEPGAERDGVAVEVVASVRTQDGREADARGRAVLSTADL